MKNQAFNPYLPSYEYIPDAEPYVFGDRVYIYGSHDRFNGTRYCDLDYVCWSASVDDLANWQYEGVIYQKTQDPKNVKGENRLYAPDVTQGADGRYYLYYALDRVGIMAVAVCDTPAGKYEFYGMVKRPDGSIIGEKGELYQFDPGIFVDDDGKIYLYTGFAMRPDTSINVNSTGGRSLGAFGSFYFELEQDMLTTKTAEPQAVIPVKWNSEGTGFEGHEFFEASSMRKIGGKYYFVYSSINSHELCYAVSDSPTGGFKYGGTLVSIGDVFLDGRTDKTALNYMGNTHGSLVQVKGQWYVFYHRQTNLHQFSRQACAEKIFIAADGTIKQAEITSCGLNSGALLGKGKYSARIACNLRAAAGCSFYSFNDKQEKAGDPYFTQDLPDCDPNPQTLPVQYIANLQNGAMAGFKYFQFDGENVKISVKVRGKAVGKICVATKLDEKCDNGEVAGCFNKAKNIVAEIAVDVDSAEDWVEFSAEGKIAIGQSAIYFIFEIDGTLEFLEFELE